MSDDRKTVLVVDDDADFVEAATVALEAKGYQVLAAMDSKQAVEMARREVPSLIVCDLMMERLYSGFSIVEELQQHEETCGIPVIMVSGVTTETGFRIDEGGQKPCWLKVVEFLNKPVDPLLLADKVQKILNSASEAEDK
ncbi:MAG: two-component system response regulator [Armatimonadota bacterium]